MITNEEATSFSNQYDGVRVIRLKINRGKGYAVKRGLFMACGDVRVFMDADGSIHPREIDKNFFYFKQGVDVVIGAKRRDDIPRESPPREIPTLGQ